MVEFKKAQDSYHSRHPCGVLDLMTATFHFRRKASSFSRFYFSRKEDLLKMTLSKLVGRVECLQSRRNISSKLLVFGL